MDFDFTREQRLLRSSAREFLKKECPTSLIREMKDNEKGYSPALWEKMAGLGWLGLMIPENYGGLGGNFLDLSILLEAMGEVCMPGPFFSTVVLGSSMITEAGSKGQKQKILPMVADGELILSLAYAEPGSRYGADGIHASAKKNNDGFVINGTKLFAENAHIADYLLCLARTDEGEKAEEGLTLFLVDAKDPGIHCTVLKTLAYDKQCEVVFENVKVPDEHVIGERGRGWNLLEKTTDQAAIAKCAEMLGSLEAVLKMTVNYAKERVQFGHPIGSFQAIQHHCANMLMDVEGSKVLAYQAAWRIAEGHPSGLEISMAKAFTGEAAQRVSRLGIQIHGAMGFCEETDVHLYYRRVKAGEVSFGDGNYHYEKVAQWIGLV